MKLAHLNLRVADVDRCRTFYTTAFGFTAAFEAEDGQFLRGSDGFLLALVPAPSHTPLPEGFHIGFVCRTAEEVHQRHAEIDRAGGHPDDVADHRSGEDYVTFRCWDPDGTEIEVYWDGFGFDGS